MPEFPSEQRLADILTFFKSRVPFCARIPRSLWEEPTRPSKIVLSTGGSIMSRQRRRLQNLWKSLLHSLRIGARPSRKPPQAHLLLEPLEERTLMASTIVEYSVPTSGSKPWEM